MTITKSFVSHLPQVRSVTWSVKMAPVGLQVPKTVKQVSFKLYKNVLKQQNSQINQTDWRPIFRISSIFVLM